MRLPSCPLGLWSNMSVRLSPLETDYNQANHILLPDHLLLLLSFTSNTHCTTLATSRLQLFSWEMPFGLREVRFFNNLELPWMYPRCLSHRHVSHVAALVWTHPHSSLPPPPHHFFVILLRPPRTLDLFLREAPVAESRLAIRELLRCSSCDDPVSLASTCGRLLSVSIISLYLIPV